ncbi:hypothetical protein PVAND_013567 [Polypedilum vanderplanki]|uniref:Uncharacterized protein n=1 Tax=Polypedilum vanderplanki TaxID=319348 RepID=A0A9J6CR19_POLVA|nr:hypothetical protein PVAND_013567 [Polypedilum vanderplanki]
MRVTRKKTFKVIPKQISNVPFRDLSHIAAVCFGNQNKRVQETDYESSDDEENQFHIDIYKRLGQEISESSQVLNMDGTLGTNVNLRENQDNQKHHNWRDLIDSESSEENESHETDNLRVNLKIIIIIVLNLIAISNREILVEH